MKLGKLPLAVSLLFGTIVSQSALADVSGTVYQDLPVDGASSNTYGVKDSNEVGIAGITVTATDSSGSVVGAPVVTSATGAWSIAGTSGDVRIEFTTIPDYLSSSANGVNSNSTVQFVTDGDTSVDLGLHDPGHFSQINPTIMISTFRSGDGKLGGSTAPTASITSFPYLSTGSGGGANTDYATAGNTGAVYGLAYQKDTGKLFSSAFVKRHVGLAGSLGSIYITESGTTTEYVDLAAAPFSINFGSVTGRDVPADLGDPSHDIDAYSKAHKAGIGDMDISPAGDALFLVNMFDKSLYKLAIGSPASASLSAADVSSFSIPSPSCNAGEWRPFGLGYGEGKLYAGGVCSGESGGDPSDISAYVYAFDLQTESFNATPALTFPLNYPRKAVNAFHSAGCSDGFQVWSDNYSDVSGYGTNDYENCYSQPSLVDLTMDVDGSLLVGLRGRIADQMGRNNYPPVANNTDLKYGQMSGDLLRASPNGDGTFSLESNAVAGSVTGCGANNDDGPGDGEFYCEDFFANNGSIAHHNTGEGSHIAVLGATEVVVAQIDPLAYDSQGIARFSNIDGTKTDAYEIIRSDTGNFGKGGGLGDMEFISDPAPLEIGNRVWDDLNSNGVQDAGEPPIEDVVVTLTCGGLVGTSTSGADGAWLIKDGDMTGSADIPRNSDCTISVPTTEPGGKTLTTQVAGTTLGSDPDASGNFTINTGASGENNHNYDIGYRLASACSITASATVSACTNVGSDADSSNDTYTVTITAAGTNASSAFNYTSSPAGISGSAVNFTASPFTTPAINIESTGSPLTLTVTDSVDNTCSTVITPDLTEPVTCSNATPQVDLEITKTVNPTSAASGGTVIYTIIASNNGPNDATGVVVNDPLPAGVTYMSDDGGVTTSESAGNVTWTVGNVNANSNAVLNITVTVD